MMTQKTMEDNERWLEALDRKTKLVKSMNDYLSETELSASDVMAVNAFVIAQCEKITNESH